MNTLSFIELLRGQPLTENERSKVLEDLRGGGKGLMTSAGDEADGNEGEENSFQGGLAGFDSHRGKDVG